MLADQPASPPARRILVIGIGRGTGRMISILHDQRSPFMETMYISTDRSSVERTRAKTKVLIGMRLFGGKGANGYPEMGEKAADDAKRDIEPHLAGYGLIVILGTLGKGTGSGALPVIASLAESTGAFVLNLCTIPSAVLESLPRTVANHTRNGMVRRGFNIVSVDQDRFLEIYGNQPIHATLASLDALIAGVVASLSEAIYGNPEKGITVSDLRTLFKEGKEGTLLVGDYDLNDPASAATTFLSTILMKGDVRASRGLLLQMMVPDGTPNGSMRSLLDAIFEKLGDRSRTVFISSMRNHDSTDRVDLFGIATGIDDTLAQIQKALKDNKDLPKNGRDASISNRWDVPMVV